MPGVDVHRLLAPVIEAGTADVILAAGGDGTARDVAAEVAGTGIPLAILAGGSTNVVAREMGMPREPEAAARALLAATARPLDLGRLTLPDGRVEQFLLAAGLGLDAHVLAATDDALKRRIGPFAIAAAAIAAAPRLRPFGVRIDVDGERLHEGRVWQIVLPNARRWGGAFSIAPGAAADDGLLDVVALARPGSVPAHRRSRRAARAAPPASLGRGGGPRPFDHHRQRRAGGRRAGWHAAGHGRAGPLRLRGRARGAAGAGTEDPLRRRATLVHPGDVRPVAGRVPRARLGA